MDRKRAWWGRIWGRVMGPTDHGTGGLAQSLEGTLHSQSALPPFFFVLSFPGGPGLVGGRRNNP